MKRSAQGIGTVHKNCVRKKDRKEQYFEVFRIHIGSRFNWASESGSKQPKIDPKKGEKLSNFMFVEVSNESWSEFDWIRIQQRAGSGSEFNKIPYPDPDPVSVYPDSSMTFEPFSSFSLL
jgi:hypothetical protein